MASIMFSPAMMPLVLSGAKIETRRVVVPQPDTYIPAKVRKELLDSCRYATGSVLWIRERMRVVAIDAALGHVNAIKVRYEADGKTTGWIEYPARLHWWPEKGKCLPYGGHREASRASIVLERVGLERLGNITTHGIKREGIEAGKELTSRFIKLWNAINLRRGYGWGISPWVFVLRFHLASPEAHKAALAALAAPA